MNSYQPWTPSTFIYNGREFPCEYRVRWTEDDLPIEGSFDFGDDAENAAYQARFDSGELHSLYVVIEVTAEGLTGCDSLGGCHVDTYAWKADLDVIIESHCMLAQAKDDLVARIKQTKLGLEKYR